MKWKVLSILLSIFVGLGVIYGGYRTLTRYKQETTTFIPIKELGNFAYPDDPAILSTFYERYNHRRLKLTQNDTTRFDFEFSSDLPHVATLTFKDVDLSLFIPAIPSWSRGNKNLEILTLVEREWNRQQVAFPPESVSIVGGDGFEKENLVSLELSRNCLNAGLWEVLLYTREAGKKTLFYHGWFTLPLGHYKGLIKRLNQISYWPYALRLEHWFSPEGKKVDLSILRTVLREQALLFEPYTHERIIAYGEQAKKLHTLQAKEVIYWGDFPKNHTHVRFATFVPPGIYKTGKEWKNAYEKIAQLEGVVLRKIRTPKQEVLDEVELTYNGLRMVISGIDLAQLPQLTPDRYPEAFYMPMGFSVPAFYESYQTLASHPPQESPYFATLLDEKDRWIDHHKVAIDGPVLFRDTEDPNLIHLYLLSYERHSLVGHVGFYLQP